MKNKRCTQGGPSTGRKTGPHEKSCFRTTGWMPEIEQILADATVFHARKYAVRQYRNGMCRHEDRAI